jgi:hypothetical protein
MLQENSKKAADRSIKTSAARGTPKDIAVGARCRLLSPGDPSEKRSVMKPKHDDLGSTLTAFNNLLYPRTQI